MKMTLPEVLLAYYAIAEKRPDTLDADKWLSVRKTYRGLVSCNPHLSLSILRDGLIYLQTEGLIELKPDRWKPRSTCVGKPKDQIERELVLSR